MIESQKALEQLEQANVPTSMVTASLRILTERLSKVQPVLSSKIQYNVLDDEIDFMFTLDTDDEDITEILSITQPIGGFKSMDRLPNACAILIAQSVDTMVDIISIDAEPMGVTQTRVRPFKISNHLRNQAAIIAAMVQIIDTAHLVQGVELTREAVDARNAGAKIVTTLHYAYETLEDGDLVLHSSFIDVFGMEIRKLMVQEYDDQGNKTIMNMLITFEQD